MLVACVMPNSWHNPQIKLGGKHSRRPFTAAHRHALPADDVLVGHQIHPIPRGRHHRAVRDAVQGGALIERHLCRSYRVSWLIMCIVLGCDVTQHALRRTRA